MFQHLVPYVVSAVVLAAFVWVNLEAIGRAMIARDRLQWEAEDEAAPYAAPHGQMLCVRAYDRTNGAERQLDCHTYSSSSYMLQYRGYLDLKIREGAYAEYRSPRIAIIKY